MITEVEDTEEAQDTNDNQIETLAGGSMAATLLLRMGIPADAELVRRTMEQTAVSIDLTPPLTTAKITGALAAVALKIASGELDPKQANALLFALQTLVGVARVSIQEEKWEEKQRRPGPTTAPSTPAPSTTNAKTQASPNTARRSAKKRGAEEKRRQRSVHPKS
jgi:hypothetical protein